MVISVVKDAELCQAILQCACRDKSRWGFARPNADGNVCLWNGSANRQQKYGASTTGVVGVLTGFPSANCSDQMIDVKNYLLSNECPMYLHPTVKHYLKTKYFADDSQESPNWQDVVKMGDKLPAGVFLMFCCNERNLTSTASAKPDKALVSFRTHNKRKQRFHQRFWESSLSLADFEFSPRMFMSASGSRSLKRDDELRILYRRRGVSLASLEYSEEILVYISAKGETKPDNIQSYRARRLFQEDPSKLTRGWIGATFLTFYFLPDGEKPVNPFVLAEGVCIDPTEENLHLFALNKFRFEGLLHQNPSLTYAIGDWLVKNGKS